MFDSSSVRAILDQGSFFKGFLSFEGAVRLAGEFEGEIKSEGTLIIESTAKVKADISVRCLILNGSLSGTVKAMEQVLMYPPAHFEGTVQSPSLKIEEGVIFEGKSLHERQG